MTKKPEPDDECAVPENVPVASSIAFSVCEHGTVHLILLDENDQAIAVAPMPVENWMALVDDIDDEIDELVDAAEGEIATTHEIGETRH